MTAILRVASTVAAIGLIAACGSHSTDAKPLSSTSAAPSSAVVTDAARSLAGLVVVLDPGHDGGNAAHMDVINTPVPDGRGRSKACNTTGTSTFAGYTEHAFNWDVANRVRAELEARGVQVVMTRHSDDGVGPCVNVRAQIGNDANAAAVVSIHADGNEKPNAHGFHVNYSSPPLNQSQATASPKLAVALRDSLEAAGYPPATYIGRDGLYPRADLAGLNLSTEPTALVECGNMHNSGDAAVLTSPDGRQRIADAITAGIVNYLSAG
jgi:N-acetylmuramoyl-L-alanine amidase